MSQSDLRELGEGIVLYEGSEPSVLKHLLARHRFLDTLWLPVPLEELSPRQIIIINRHREATIEGDAQYEYASRAQRTVALALCEAGINSLVEVGCGKFPLCRYAPFSKFLGVDLDPEALQWLDARRIDSVSPAGLVADPGGPRFQAVASIFAFHFAISDHLLHALKRVALPEAVICFNLISDTPTGPLNTLAKLGIYWPSLKIVKAPAMARREFFVVGATVESLNVASKIAGAIEHSYSR